MHRDPCSRQNADSLCSPSDRRREGVPTLALNMMAWKHDFLRRYFPERRFIFVPIHIAPKELTSRYSEYLGCGKDAFVWSLNGPEKVLSALRESGTTTYIVEDGFLRSGRAFSSRTLPLSLCIDSETAHFDARLPSALEALLSSYDFSADHDLMARARAGIATITSLGLTKYNGAPRISGVALYGQKNRKRVLVIGQVDGDASIRFGCSSGLTQTKMIKLAAEENPDAEIIFRPHPDVTNGVRPTNVKFSEISAICRVVTTPASIADALETIDRVYTLTSLAGFEALLRDIPVTVLGYPFYAGWGLTDDRASTNRRRRHLSVEELFAGSYLIYPIYFDPAAQQISSFEQVASLLSLSGHVDVEIQRPLGLRSTLRHRMAVKMIKPIVERVGTQEDGRYFEDHPFHFFQERPSSLLRYLGRVFFDSIPN